MFSKEILVKFKVPKHIYDKKDILFHEDEIAKYLYYLLEGEVQIHNIDSEGKNFSLQKLLSTSFWVNLLFYWNSAILQPQL